MLFNLNKKICVIKQPGGLGDIFYLQKLTHTLKPEYDIYWYVVSQYFWVKDYIKGVNFLDKETEEMYTPLRNNQMFHNIYQKNTPFQNEEMLYIPTLFAHDLLPNFKVMNSKYKLVGIDHDDWVDYFKFTRNQEKENKLFYDVLGLKDGEEYCFVTKNIGLGGTNKLEINYQGKLKVIEMKYTDGFTLLDWCKVVENASEIHIADSSISLVVEKLKLSTDKIFLYTRRSGDFSEIDYLFKKKITMVDL